MPGHEALASFIEHLPPDKKDRMASRLAFGDKNRFTENFPEFEQFLTNNPHEIDVLSLGNNKCYKVANAASPGELFVIKLERFTMPQEVVNLFKNNADVQRFLAPMFLNVDCKGEDNNPKKIQIQPFCKGGTIVNAAAAAMTDEERIKNCITLYKSVTSFYMILENINPPVLFPDGKPSNFTLGINNQLQITDMKTFNVATETVLRECAQIDSPDYPLFLSRPPPPRELKKIHSRHVGINLYSYLTQAQFGSFSSQSLPNMNFSEAIFQTEKGEFFKKIIQATFSEDQNKRPDVEEIQKALFLIELLTQLDDLMQADPGNNDLRAFGVSIKAEFKRSIENNLPLRPTLKQLKDRVDLEASLKKINDLLNPLVTQNNANFNKYLDDFITEIRSELSGNSPKPTLKDIVSKLEYRTANEEIIKQTYARLDHIKALYNDSLYEYSDSLYDYELHETPQPKLKTYFEDGSEAFLNAIQNKRPLQDIAAEVEYLEKNFEAIRNIHGILDKILQKNNFSEDFKTFVSHMNAQFENIATSKEDPQKFLNELRARDKAIHSMEVSLEKLTGLFQKHPHNELEEFIKQTKQAFNSRIRDNLSFDDLFTGVNEKVTVLEKNANIRETKEERRGDRMRFHKAGTESQTKLENDVLDEGAVSHKNSKMPGT